MDDMDDVVEDSSTSAIAVIIIARLSMGGQLSLTSDEPFVEMDDADESSGMIIMVTRFL